jgi:hypothetical protein
MNSSLPPITETDYSAGAWSAGTADYTSCPSAKCVSWTLLCALQIDLIEAAAIGKMRLVRFLPVAEEFLQGEPLQRREIRSILGGD